MLVLGLLLIVAALLVGFGAVYDGGETATVEILGQTVTTTVAGVFVAGAVAMLVLLLGVMALMASMKRGRRKRVEHKETKNRQKASVQQLEDERAALRAENERLSEKLSDSGQPPMGSTAVTAGAAGAAGTAGTTSATPDDQQGHEQRSGARGLMDKVTGRTGDDHADHADHDRTVSPPPGQTSQSGQSDRVVDSSTDLTAQEQTSTSGRHRDTI